MEKASASSVDGAERKPESAARKRARQKWGLKRWPGVVLSLLVSGFGLYRAGRKKRFIGWLVGIQGGAFLICFAFGSALVPMGVAYVLLAIGVMAFVAMLKDSYRPGKMRGKAWLLFVILLGGLSVAGPPLRNLLAQPFRIPTGAMAPTVRGVMGTPFESAESFPESRFRKAFEQFWHGRRYVDAWFNEDDSVRRVYEERRRFFGRSKTKVHCESGHLYVVDAPLGVVMHDFKAQKTFGYINPAGVPAMRGVRKGQSIARGTVTAADRVFCNKLAYLFTSPGRGDLVAFTATGIEGILNNGVEQIYLKRVVGLPGETIEIRDGKIHIGGRVLTQEDGIPPAQYTDNGGHGTRGRPFAIPEKTYFVLGDNSARSSDSRDWGVVPAENVIGEITKIYFPFGRMGKPVFEKE